MSQHTTQMSKVINTPTHGGTNIENHPTSLMGQNTISMGEDRDPRQEEATKVTGIEEAETVVMTVANRDPDMLNIGEKNTII